MSSNAVTVPHALFKPKPNPVLQVRDVLEQIFKGLQTPLLHRMIAWSLQCLRTEFLPAGSDEEIVALERRMASASRNVQLTIFFFLLNVHMQLKDYIMEIDPCNSRKLVRFMSDLRKYVVVRFCSNETQSVDEFVDLVHECYMLA
jgi:hypothetical protein